MFTAHRTLWSFDGLKCFGTKSFVPMEHDSAHSARSSSASTSSAVAAATVLKGETSAAAASERELAMQADFDDEGDSVDEALVLDENWIYTLSQQSQEAKKGEEVQNHERNESGQNDGDTTDGAANTATVRRTSRRFSEKYTTVAGASGAKGDHLPRQSLSSEEAFDEECLTGEGKRKRGLAFEGHFVNGRRKHLSASASKRGRRRPDTSRELTLEQIRLVNTKFDEAYPKSSSNSDLLNRLADREYQGNGTEELLRVLKSWSDRRWGLQFKFQKMIQELYVTDDKILRDGELRKRIKAFKFNHGALPVPETLLPFYPEHESKQNTRKARKNRGEPLADDVVAFRNDKDDERRCWRLGVIRRIEIAGSVLVRDVSPLFACSETSSKDGEELEFRDSQDAMSLCAATPADQNDQKKPPSQRKSRRLSGSGRSNNLLDFERALQRVRAMSSKEAAVENAGTTLCTVPDDEQHLRVLCRGGLETWIGILLACHRQKQTALAKNVRPRKSLAFGDRVWAFCSNLLESGSFHPAKIEDPTPRNLPYVRFDEDNMLRRVPFNAIFM
ncbi:hypothetical protein FVE85_5959 [Porphyridium purpureum]|uniref:Uncharacterized protein n=1 Tax=Porphyridium purpureum TaxID=35688 RepID=A0A5J4Z5W0_PORPP|nr:hypothetical protein FVE85_5959 [Porphyridium purpureum]|eukprot:POR4231..scf295_1